MNKLYNTLLVGKVLIPAGKTASTNELATQLLKQSKPVEGTVVFTTTQTMGKGQYGNSWFTGQECNLAISAVLYPTFLQAVSHFHLNMAMSLAVAACVDKFIGQNASVKWPNDIYVGDRKIAGILIENAISGTRFTSSIVGIGLNINQTDFPDWIPNPTSLGLIKGKEIKINEVLHHLCKAIESKYLQLLQGRYEKIRYDYRAMQYRLGTVGLYRSGSKPWVGMITGISPEGKLIVERNGQPFEFGFKEIEYL